MVRTIMFDKIRVAKHLTDSEYKVFLEVHAKHNISLPFEERKIYSLPHVLEVAKTQQDNGLIIYYRNSEQFCYTYRGSWFLKI